jgi:hypothetical protein
MQQILFKHIFLSLLVWQVSSYSNYLPRLMLLRLRLPPVEPAKN